MLIITNKAYLKASLVEKKEKSESDCNDWAFAAETCAFLCWCEEMTGCTMACSISYLRESRSHSLIQQSMKSSGTLTPAA